MPFCHLVSKNQKFLKFHIDNIHIKNTEDPAGNKADEITINANETCSKCQHCTFIGNNVDMEKHVIKTHGVAVICGECGNTFPDTKTCEKHIEAKHNRAVPVLEPFPCDECHLVLANFNLLQSRKTKHHTPNSRDEPFRCDKCNDVMQDFPSLTKHKKEKHTLH